MPTFSDHKRIDCHMHTPLCGHASGEPCDYVDEAARKGISLITFTCHIPMHGEDFSQTGIRMRHADLPRYREMVKEAQAYGETLGVEVLYGIEAEIHMDQAAMADMRETIEEEPFDFVLGSLHHMLPGFRRWLEEEGCHSDEKRITGYFESLAAGAASGLYHSLSHPDVIRLYATLQDPFDPQLHAAVIKDFLDVTAESGVCLEINTSGLIKGDFIVHPDPVIMQWALERDIPFTIGSDSHNPKMVGQFFEDTLKQFKNMGLTRLHYFKKGIRQAIPI